jgi:hypothetical protein
MSKEEQDEPDDIDEDDYQEVGGQVEDDLLDDFSDY